MLNERERGGRRIRTSGLEASGCRGRAAIAVCLVLVAGTATTSSILADQLIDQLAYLLDSDAPADPSSDFYSLESGRSDLDSLELKQGQLRDGRKIRNEIYLLEDKDYPRSLFEDYPRRVGQVSGITTLPNNDVAIFHRSQRQWDGRIFDNVSKTIPMEQQDKLLANDTIMILDGDDGNAKGTFGADLFYMPHGIASDGLGNLWVSDVARHQVMRMPSTSVKGTYQSQGNGPHLKQVWPDVILGEAFVPGNDAAHFCQPAELAASADGRLVFVADGYCNRRVVVYTGAGQRLGSFGEAYNMSVVHSLALMEERNLVCVADRENGRILCFRAGLDGDLAQLGKLEHLIDYPLGRVFALAALSIDHLLVSSNEPSTSRYDLAILNPFTSELKLVWTSSDLLEPHSLASTRDRQAAYAADISRDAYKKVFKFNIIQRLN